MMKMTKREMYMTLIELMTGETHLDNLSADVCETMLDKLKHEIDLLDKKGSATRGLTKTQKENIEIKNRLVDFLTDKAPMRVSEIVATDDFGMYSPSKISALLTQLKKEGRVIRTEVKKVPFYSV